MDFVNQVKQRRLFLLGLVDGHTVWGKVYTLLIESTPPPPSLGSLSIQQTPWLHNTGNFANSSKHRKYIDNVLKEELGTIYVSVPGFWQASRLPKLFSTNATSERMRCINRRAVGGVGQRMLKRAMS